MKFFAPNKNNLSLLAVSIITIGFFVAALFDELNNIMIVAVLFIGFGVLLSMAIYYGYKNHKKNRLED